MTYPAAAAPKSAHALIVIPPSLFSRMLAIALEGNRRMRAQNAPCNDGRTGYIVDYSRF